MDDDTLNEIKEAIVKHDEHKELLEIAQGMSDVLEHFAVLSCAFIGHDKSQEVAWGYLSNGETTRIFVATLDRAHDAWRKWKEWRNEPTQLY